MKTVLILGANGRFGRNAKAAFSWAGWRVRSFDRSRDTLSDAAHGVDIIVNAWNPLYPDWAAQLPVLTDQVIAAAKSSGATVLIPGNIYPYGAAMPEDLRETTPHLATNPLGRLRIEMEDAYRKAGVQTIILRAGDFIDTAPSGNWFDKVLTAKISKGRFTYPGNPDIAHSWAFLPDLAETAVALAAKADSLDQFCEVNFPGYTLTGRELMAALETATGHQMTLKKMAWWPLYLARPVWPMAAPLLEMRYLWNTPHRVVSDKLAALVLGYAPTDLVEALRASLPEQIDRDGRMTRGELPPVASAAMDA